MAAAPHLPPKEESISLGGYTPSLASIFVIIVIVALTSVALTLATAVYLVPSVIPDHVITRIVDKNSNGSEFLDSTVVTGLRSRTWTIYDKRKKIENLFYPSDVTSAKAVTISSDGWLVAYLPDYRAGQEKNWDFVGPQGEDATALLVVPDSLSGYVYLKTDQSGLPFIRFADRDVLEKKDQFWVMSDSFWQLSNVSSRIRDRAGKSVAIWQPQVRYKLVSEFKKGSMVVADDGSFVGAVDSEGFIAPGYMIENQLATVLKTGEISYLAFPVYGFMASGILESVEPYQKYSGFYVDRSTTKTSSTTLGVGDLILSINNEPVSQSKLHAQVLFASEDSYVSVLRDGKEIELKVEKTLAP